MRTTQRRAAWGQAPTRAPTPPSMTDLQQYQQVLMADLSADVTGTAALKQLQQTVKSIPILQRQYARITSTMHTIREDDYHGMRTCMKALNELYLDAAALSGLDETRAARTVSLASEIELAWEATGRSAVRA